MDENMDFLNLHGVKKKMNKYQKFKPKKNLASIHEGYLGSLTENVSYDIKRNDLNTYNLHLKNDSCCHDNIVDQI